MIIECSTLPSPSSSSSSSTITFDFLLSIISAITFLVPDDRRAKSMGEVGADHGRCIIILDSSRRIGETGTDTISLLKKLLSWMVCNWRIVEVEVDEIEVVVSTNEDDMTVMEDVRCCTPDPAG